MDTQQEQGSTPPTEEQANAAMPPIEGDQSAQQATTSLYFTEFLSDAELRVIAARALEFSRLHRATTSSDMSRVGERQAAAEALCAQLEAFALDLTE